MVQNKAASFFIGFLILFSIYHLPEFFSAFWLMAICKIGFLVIAYLLAKAQGWQGLNGYGLSFKGKWITNLLAGLLFGIIFFTVAFGLSIILGYEKIASVNSISVLVGQLPFILLMTAIPSIAEDILTRGYLYAHTSKFLRIFVWMLLSSVIYVLNHIWRLDDGLAVLGYLFLLGMVLAYAVWITKSLWLAFGIHWGANIAFECTNTAVSTITSGTTNTSNWILAGSWALLLVLLFIARQVKNTSAISTMQEYKE